MVLITLNELVHLSHGASSSIDVKVGVQVIQNYYRRQVGRRMRGTMVDPIQVFEEVINIYENYD